MSKYYKSYVHLDWFEDVLNNTLDEVFCEFFSEMLGDVESYDMSLYSYISYYLEDGFMKNNIIRNLKLGKLPQPEYLHKLPFLSKEASDWLEWYYVNNMIGTRAGVASKPYVEKWKNKPEPERPETFEGRNPQHKIRRQISREHWLARAWDLGV